MTCRFSPDALKLESTPVDNLFITAYLPEAEGLAVKVYLYGLMQCRYPGFGTPVFEALGCTEAEVKDAFLYWQSVGLVRIVSDEPFTVEYRSVSERTASPALPGRHFELVRDVQARFTPRQLSVPELDSVFDWAEVYLFDHGAILTLIDHCLKRKGRRVSMKYMNTVARAWADAGVHSQEDAQKQSLLYHELTGGCSAVLKRWRMSREATEDELMLYRKWTKEWNFSDEAVLSACAALTRAYSPSFRYLDSVLDGLRAEGAKNAADVERVLEQQDAASMLARQVFSRAGILRAARLEEREQLRQFADDWGMPSELILYAAELSRGAREPFGTIKRLVCDWHEKNVRTMRQAQKETPPNLKRKNPAATDYEQRSYSNEELAHLFVDLDKE